MGKKRVTVVGHYSDSLDGQTIKTKIVTDELCIKYGNCNVQTLNTSGGLIALFRIMFKLPYVLKNSSSVVIIPAHNALRILALLISFWNHFYKTPIHYCVIGGWLPSFLKKKKYLRRRIMKFAAIYVETTFMKKTLEEDGFNNIVLMPNCKKIRILEQYELVGRSKYPLKVCTFSRVNKNKGIEEAVAAVVALNTTHSNVICYLDIYGQIDESDKRWFDDLLKRFPDYISYKGTVRFDETVEVLKNYFALLFPTKYFTEGIPGTIIDAFASGLPVISSRWQNYADIIDDGVTGYTFEFGNNDEFTKILERVCSKTDLIDSLRLNCIKKAHDYSPYKIVDILNV